MANRETQIKILYNKYSHLFGCPINSIAIKKEKNLIHSPFSGRSYMDGIPLKDGVGFITISELYESDEVKSYTYRFFSKEYKCITICTSDNSRDKQAFEFHYDKVKDDIPHKPHLSIIYTDIRYLTEKITLEQFLMFIQETFFVRDEGKFKRKQGKLWANRM
jgi:hypothetical protein